MTLEDAKQFINYNIKEGVYEAEQFDGMTDAQLIRFAESESDRAEYYANSFEQQESEQI